MNRVGYFGGLGGLFLSLLLFILGFMRDIPLATALGLFGIILFILILGMFTLPKSRSNKAANMEAVEYLYNLSQTHSSDSLATIDLGRRWPAITLSHHLTSGRMVIIDVYNPQLMPARSLARNRQRYYPATPSDPRLAWYDSNLDLLPLPDSCVSAVFLYHVLSEIAQKGDQLALLKEIARILEPDGRLLVAELANTWPNRLRFGLGLTRTKPHEYWRGLLEESGFIFQRAQTIQGATICLRADKPSPYAGSQMSLDLDFEAY